MKAGRVVRFGPPNVITYDDLPRPEPATGQLLVRVKAAGVCNWDALIREGKVELQPLPVILACLAPANLCKPTLLPQAEHAAKCLAFERTPTATPAVPLPASAGTSRAMSAQFRSDCPQGVLGRGHHLLSNWPDCCHGPSSQS